MVLGSNQALPPTSSTAAAPHPPTSVVVPPPRRAAGRPWSPRSSRGAGPRRCYWAPLLPPRSHWCSVHSRWSWSVWRFHLVPKKNIQKPFSKVVMSHQSGIRILETFMIIILCCCFFQTKNMASLEYLFSLVGWVDAKWYFRQRLQ